MRVRWQGLPNSRLYWRAWDEEHVVYNSVSGDTHVLDPVSALLVQEIVRRPSETSELIPRIGELLAFKPTEEFERTLLDSLRTLDQLGLIEAVPH